MYNISDEMNVIAKTRVVARQFFIIIIIIFIINLNVFSVSQRTQLLEPLLTRKLRKAEL